MVTRVQIADTLTFLGIELDDAGYNQDLIEDIYLIVNYGKRIARMFPSIGDEEDICNFLNRKVSSIDNRCSGKWDVLKEELNS